MKIEIKIDKITIIENSGSDLVYMEAKNLKSGIWPFEGGQIIKFDIAKSGSIDWIKVNFGEEFLKITKIIKTN